MDYQNNCGALLKQINDEMGKQANNGVRENGLTIMQCSVLVLLGAAAEQQLPLKELERQLRVAQSTAAGIVARLEQKGLVEGLEDAADRRVKLVRLTGRGLERCRQAQQGMDQAEERLLHSLTAEERKEFHRLLQKVQAYL